jgi:hypothetical protein
MTDETQSIAAAEAPIAPPNPWKEIGYVLESGERTHGDLEQYAASLRADGEKVRLVLLKHG